MILLRALKIIYIFGRHRLDRNLPNTARTWRNLPLLLFKLFPMPKQSAAESTRLALESLGPIFIKFGQLLSTRQDLLSPNMATQLALLQDQVAPFDEDIARKIIEASLEANLESIFFDFEPKPLASASLAQVHSAKLKDRPSDESVVIKVIRPNVLSTIKKDIRLMYFFGKILKRIWPEGRRLKPLHIVRDYEKTILKELDLTEEAANTIRLRENWHQSGKLYVPRVFEAYSSKTILVMELISGVKATDTDSLSKGNVNLKKLAHLGVEIFFKQVFEDNFFHADMHPGNVFIDISDPENPTYIALDCAIIGSLTEEDRNYLGLNLLAFFRRDYEEVARLHVRSGWVPPDTNISEFTAVIRHVVDPFFHKPINEISFGTVLLQLFQTASEFKMEVQPQLILLQKTLINIEGMGREIYPNLDLWETAAPIMEKWMSNRVGVRAMLKRITQNAPHWLEKLPEVPDLILSALQEMGELSDNNRKQVRMLNEMQSTLAKQTKKTRSQALGGLVMICAVFSMMLPATGYAAAIDPIISGSVLGTLVIYWMYLHS